MSTGQDFLEKCVLKVTQAAYRSEFVFEMTLPTIFHLRVLDNFAFTIFCQEKGHDFLIRIPHNGSSTHLLKGCCHPALTSAKSDHHVESSLIKLHVGSQKPGTESEVLNFRFPSEPIRDGR